MHVIVTMRSEDLPAEDRFAWWREQVVKDTVPTAISSPHAADFRAALTLAELGPVHLSILSFPVVRSVRTPALVRRSDPERYGIILNTANDLYHAQCDRDGRSGRDSLLLYDTSQPYEYRSLPGSGLGGAVFLQMPKAVVPLRPQRLNQLLGRRLPGRGGMNAILAQYLSGVATAVQNGEVSERETQRLGQVALDLAVATLATHVDAEDQPSPETRAQALLARIEVFIEHNLGDTDLTPAVIAAQHHISLAYLYRLFEPRELTVAAWIRRQRLERARADLADPRFRGRPVQAIAARWGFRYATDFNRAFRAVHGVPPGDYRRRVLAQE